MGFDVSAREQDVNAKTNGETQSLKPERIQFAPPMGGGNHDISESDWNAAIYINRKFALAPSSEVPFIASVLTRARSLPSPPKVTFVIDASPDAGASVGLEWGEAPLTDVEIDFVRWVSGLHAHMSTAVTAAS